MSEENSAAVASVADTANRLAGVSDSLKASVSRFRVYIFTGRAGIGRPLLHYDAPKWGAILLHVNVVVVSPH